jgi:small subunit ribosomal protein S17
MADTSSAPGTTATPTKTTGRRILQGIVTRDNTSKTRRVEVERLVRHPKYGKFVKRRTVCYVHDEKNESHLGDTVEIVESRPLSKMKRWELIKIVTKAPSRTLSNLEGAVAGSDAATPAPKADAPAPKAEEKK